MNDSGRKWKTGLVILGVTGAVVGGLYAVATPFILPAFRRVCLPYVPATTAQVANVFSVLERAAASGHGALLPTRNALHGTGRTIAARSAAEDGRGSGEKAVSKVLVDLGSGDGRIVIEAASLGFQGVGYELNPWLVWYSRLAARQAGVNRLTSFQRADLWKVSLSRFDVIVIFGVSQMMDALEKKISEEVKPSACVVACRFPLPGWEPKLSEGAGVDEVWFYTAPSSDKPSQ